MCSVGPYFCTHWVFAAYSYRVKVWTSEVRSQSYIAWEVASSLKRVASTMTLPDRLRRPSTRKILHIFAMLLFRCKVSTGLLIFLSRWFFHEILLFSTYLYQCCPPPPRVIFITRSRFVRSSSSSFHLSVPSGRLSTMGSRALARASPQLWTSEIFTMYPTHWNSPASVCVSPLTSPIHSLPLFWP